MLRVISKPPKSPGAGVFSGVKRNRFLAAAKTITSANKQPVWAGVQLRKTPQQQKAEPAKEEPAVPVVLKPAPPSAEAIAKAEAEASAKAWSESEKSRLEAEARKPPPIKVRMLALAPRTARSWAVPKELEKEFTSQQVETFQTLFGLYDVDDR